MSAHVSATLERTKSHLTPRARLLGTLAIVAGVFVSVLSSTIVNVPLGSIAHDLNASIATATLLITAAAVVFAALLPLGDWLGNRLGRRTVFCAAVAALGLGSLIAIVAPNINVLIAARVLQGAGGAAIAPLVMTLLSELYDAGERALALSTWAMANSAGQALGPPLGGVLTSFFGWRSIFVPALVIAVVACVAGLRSLPADTPRTLPLEWRGASSLTIGALILFGTLSVAPQLGLTSAPFLALMAAGCLCIALFVRAMHGTARPFVSPRAFADPAYRTSCIAVFAATICFGSALLAIPLYLTQVLALPVALAGIMTLALPLAMAVIAPLTSAIIKRCGSGRTLQLGLIALAAGTAVIAVAAATQLGIALLLPAMVLIGAAVAAEYTAGAVGTTNSKAGREGAGIGLFNLLRIGGSAVGASLVAIVLQYHAHAYGSIFGITAIVAVVAAVATVVSEAKAAA